MLDIHLSDPDVTDPNDEVLDHVTIHSDLGDGIFTKESTKYAVDQFKPYNSPGENGMYPIMLQEGWGTLQPFYLEIWPA